MLVQCCVCGRIRKGAEWVNSDQRDTPMGRVSHGYCPTCATKAFEDIQKYHKHLPTTTERAISA